MEPADDFLSLREPQFKAAIDKLESLLSQGSRVVLIGAGCSKCAGLPLTAELTAQILTSKSLAGC